VTWHAVGDEVRQLGQGRLGDDHGAGLAQISRQRGVVRHHQALERDRAPGGRHVGGMDVVLQRNRDAVQRAAHLAGPPLAIEAIGFLERLRVHRQRGVQFFFIERDANQVLLHELARGDAAFTHRALHLGDRRFDHRETRSGFGLRRKGSAGQGHGHGHAGCEDH
jgi:hypothetical protein